MGDYLYLDEQNEALVFLKTVQVFEIWVGPGFKFISPGNSRINLKNFVWSLQIISLRVSRLRFNSCLVMEMVSFVSNDLIVKKPPLLYLFKLFWSSFWLIVLNREGAIKNWFSKKNANSFVFVFWWIALFQTLVIKLLLWGRKWTHCHG